MLAKVRQAAEAVGGAAALYVGGLAPLPLFSYIAQHTTLLASGMFLFNRRKDGVWELLPLTSGDRIQRPFFELHVLRPANVSLQGRLAIFISNLGQPAPRHAIEDLFRRQNQDLAALIEIRTAEWTNLDDQSSPRAFMQMCEFLAQIPLQYPEARSSAFFIAGPTALASMLGFALPSNFPDPWLTNYDHGAYHVAIPTLPTEFPALSDDVSPALRLRMLRVQGFKSIRDSGEVAMPSLAVIVGRNGSGKSSLLEALQWLQRAASQGLQAATRSFHSFSDLRNKGCALMEISLEMVGEGEEPPLRYSLVVSEGVRGVPVIEEEHCTFGERVDIFTEERVRWIVGGPSVRDPDRLALVSVAGTGALGAVRLRAFLGQMVFLRLSPRHLAQPGDLQPDPQGPPLDEEGARLPALLDSLSPDNLRAVTERMQEAFSGSAAIQGVDLQRNSIERTGVLVVEHRLPDQFLGNGAHRTSSFRLPAWVLSEGTRRLSALFALLTRRPVPSLLAIEEVENGLDPWAIEHVLSALVQGVDAGANVIITTHSPYFLDKFDPDQIIHAVYENGESHYRLITSYEDVVRYGGDVTPGIMYISDYFSKSSR